MDLILWRHADADAGVPDSGRKLTAKGRKQAAKIAKWLKARLPEGTRVLCSPARRAKDTAAALTKDFKAVDALGLDANAKTVLAAAGWPKADGCVVVVGHQPTLGNAAALALAGTAADWSIKKGALFWLVAREQGGRYEVSVRAAITPDLV